MFTFIGYLGGIFYCLYSICFRWSALRNMYGRYDLNFWASYVVWGFSFIGWLVDVAVFIIWYSISV